MFLHRGLQNLRRQVEEICSNRAHQHHGPFDKPGNLGQQAGVFDNLQPLRKGGIGRVVPDVIGPLGGVQHHMRAFQLGGIVVKGLHRDLRARRHEAVPAGRVACGDAVDLQRHGFGARLGHEDAQDRMQRPHPAQAARAPAHGFRPREIAHRAFQHFGHDHIRRAARLFQRREPDLTLFVVAGLQLIAGQTGGAQKAFQRLFRGIDARSLALFAQGRAFGQQPFDGQNQPPRGRKRRRRGIGQPGLDKPIGHQLLEVGGSAPLHAGGDFFGEEFDQQIRHRVGLRQSGQGRASRYRRSDGTSSGLRSAEQGASSCLLGKRSPDGVRPLPSAAAFDVRRDSFRGDRLARYNKNAPQTGGRFDGVIPLWGAFGPCPIGQVPAGAVRPSLDAPCPRPCAPVF